MIVSTESNFIKTIPEIVLREQLEPNGVAISDKFFDTLWQTMGKL